MKKNKYYQDSDEIGKYLSKLVSIDTTDVRKIVGFDLGRLW